MAEQAAERWERCLSMVECRASEGDAEPCCGYTMGIGAKWIPVDTKRVLKSATNFGRGLAGSVSEGSKTALDSAASGSRRAVESAGVRLFCVGGPEGARRGCERHGESYLTRRRRGEAGDGGGSLTGGAIPSA